ncbi:hypothetical protein DOE73_29270 [Paenibacillus dendritiformis]|nr:hypothetical protein DOE73_29270 [Paenibacillus dendritiformis]
MDKGTGELCAQADMMMLAGIYRRRTASGCARARPISAIMMPQKTAEAFPSAVEPSGFSASHPRGSTPIQKGAEPRSTPSKPSQNIL